MRTFIASVGFFAVTSMLAACTHGSNVVTPPAMVNDEAVPPQIATATTGRTIPFFQSSFAAEGKTFTYEMVGSNPFTAPSTVTIPTVIIPVELRFGSLTFSPTTAVNSILQSPIFHVGTPYAAGRLQYGDALMRSEFWSFVHANANYHVLLATPVIKATKVLTITSTSQGFVGSTSGTRTAFLHSQYFLDPGGIEQQLLASDTISPGSLAIFALTDTRVLEESGACCYNGYHTSFTVSSATGASTFTTVWGNVSASTPLDLSHVSHEVAEWLDDPFYSPPATISKGIAQFNHVPPWIHPVTMKCDSAQLEVGDPLVTVHFTVNDSIKTFTVQDVAFYSWFTRASPSIGIDGRYDLLGTLKTPAGVC